MIIYDVKIPTKMQYTIRKSLHGIVISIKILPVRITINVAIITGILSALISVGSVGAQQQTTGGLLTTRNPQQSQTDLFQQNNDVQNSTGLTTLNAQGKINIPAGQPATAESDLSESNSSSNWLIGLMILAAIITFSLIFYAMKQYEGPDGDTLKNVTEKSAEEPVVIKKPTAKKKKRRTQTKKKKR